ncbi:hypothetical protein D3C71_317980 [compost metagenome]
MDFPKSVPGVGLVAGRFVNEDPIAGRAGSLIPAEWGNAITDELLAVVQAAGMEPDEGNNGQVLAAIRNLIGEGPHDATEMIAGLIRIATESQAQLLEDDTAALTPYKLSMAIWALTGYQAFIGPGVFTFTRPVGVTKVKVRVHGGGGGGASDVAAAPGPSGGGEGGYWEGIFDISAVPTVTVTVGAGGAGATAVGTNGGPGGASSFGAYCSAQGGQGGVRTANSPQGGSATGTSGFGWKGGSGGAALSGAGGSIFGGAGGGGWSPFAASDPSRPERPGCGGGGRISSAGAPGAHGAVFIEW